MRITKEELNEAFDRAKKAGWTQYELQIFRFIRGEFNRGDVESCKVFFEELFDRLDHKKAALMALYLELFPETLKCPD